MLNIDSNINPNIGLHTSQQYVGQFQAPWRLRMGSPPSRPPRKSLAKTQPWKKLGMSKAAWYRKGKPVRQVCSNKDKYEQSRPVSHGWAAESKRKLAAERRRSTTAVAKVHTLSASFQLSALPASTDLSRSSDFCPGTKPNGCWGWPHEWSPN